MASQGASVTPSGSISPTTSRKAQLTVMGGPIADYTYTSVQAVADSVEITAEARSAGRRWPAF